MVHCARVGPFESAMVQFWEGGTPILKLHVSRTNGELLGCRHHKIAEILKVVGGVPQYFIVKALFPKDNIFLNAMVNYPQL
jgi:hypothetical protein